MEEVLDIKQERCVLRSCCFIKAIAGGGGERERAKGAVGAALRALPSAGGRAAPTGAIAQPDSTRPPREARASGGHAQIIQIQQLIMLYDRYNRVHDYLRISLTDACNFRCSYCMPDENITCMPSQKLMTTDEIVQIAEVFVGLGTKKIRLTGGEPLVRKDAREIIARLSRFPVELTLTTNGVLIDEFLETLKAAGVRSLNLSLDTLDADKFKIITKRDAFERVWKNINLLIDNGFYVKINMVLMRGVNDDEVLNFVRLTKTMPLHLRFIEFMPFDGNQWISDKVMTADELLMLIDTEFSFMKLKDGLHETAKKFKPYGHAGTFAIITTMSNAFCGSCNRMRLTADGKMKNCLFSTTETDLLSAFRNGEDIKPLIESCIRDKHAERGGQFTDDFGAIDTSQMVNRSMIKIGG